MDINRKAMRDDKVSDGFEVIYWVYTSLFVGSAFEDGADCFDGQSTGGQGGIASSIRRNVAISSNIQIGSSPD